MHTGHERCPVCHRQQPVGKDGNMLFHRSGSSVCSGSRRSGLTLAKSLTPRVVFFVPSLGFVYHQRSLVQH